MSLATSGIERRGAIAAEAFLEDYYAASRPVILTKEMADWPATAPEASGDPAGVVRHLAKFLAQGAGPSAVSTWAAGAGDRAALRHDPANLLIVQAAGRQRLLLVPPAYGGRLQDSVSDLEDPGLDLGRFPRMAGVPAYEVILEAGEVLYLPLGWWRQARMLEPGVSLAFSNFVWPNDAAADYPAA